MRKGKKSKSLLILLILGISVGYALLSTTLGINGVSGINKNTWDIHWDDESIKETDGSVTPISHASVVDTEKKNITFDIELGVPGDYYEFTADAKNYGSISGVVDEVKVSIYEDGSDEPIDPADLSSDIKYSFTYADGNTIEVGDVLEAGESIKYKFRIEYDENATSLPTDNTPKKIVIEVPINQPLPDDPTKPYKVTFNANGGVVDPTTKNVERGESIGELPIPTKGSDIFVGWYTDLNGGEKINSSYVPTSNMTLYAHWNDLYSMFAPGQTVNKKLKKIAGNVVDEENPKDTEDNNILNIVNSSTAPDLSTMTDDNIISSEDSPLEIYAWFDNGTIYWWSEADKWLNTDSSYMFYNLRSLKTMDTSFNTGTATNMSGMFGWLMNIEELDLSNFDTSNVTNMSGMFAPHFSEFPTKIHSLDLSKWDVSKVTSMSGMFFVSGLEYINVSGWNTKSLTDMSGMFNYCTGLKELDLSSFDVSNVTNMGGVFTACTALENLDISGWNFAKVNSISGLFNGLASLKHINLTNVNTSNVTSMGGLFAGCCDLIELDLSSFDISNVVSVGGMFNQCYALRSINMSGWNFAKVNSISGLFNQLDNLEEINFEGVNTSNVTEMANVFYNCTYLRELDLTDFDTRNVTNMSNMFSGCALLKTILVGDNFVVDQVEYSNDMFKEVYSIIGGNGTTYSSSHLDKEYARYDGGIDNPGYFNASNAEYNKIIYNANGGKLYKSFKKVLVGEEIGILPTPERDGYTFDGWYTGLTDGTMINANYIPDGDMQIYAHWTRN